MHFENGSGFRNFVAGYIGWLLLLRIFFLSIMRDVYDVLAIVGAPCCSIMVMNQMWFLYGKFFKNLLLESKRLGSKMNLIEVLGI